VEGCSVVSVITLWILAVAGVVVVFGGQRGGHLGSVDEYVVMMQLVVFNHTVHLDRLPLALRIGSFVSFCCPIFRRECGGIKVGIDVTLV
jgi:hypothetical protein